MEYTDVDQICNPIGVRGCKIVLHVPDCVALAVDHRAEIIKGDALGLINVEHADIRRQCQCSGYLAGGVVISRRDDNRNAFIVEPHHLLNEELAGTEIVPGSVVQVAGDDQQIGLAVHYQVDQIHKSSAGTEPKLARSFLANSAQPTQWAIQMDVSGMNQ